MSTSMPPSTSTHPLNPLHSDTNNNNTTTATTATTTATATATTTPMERIDTTDISDTSPLLTGHIHETSNTTAPIVSQTSGAVHNIETLPGSISSTSSTTTNVTHSNTGMGSLLEYPTTIICSDCATVIAIPVQMWYWTCSKGHPDNVREHACKTCAEPCPRNLPWPAVECAYCHTKTTIPSTELAAVLKGGVYTIKSAVKSVIDGPSTFHCVFCNTLLMMPKGQWKCTACECTNGEKIVRCTKCSQDRYEQNILCGSCGKSTTIPKSGVLDSLRAGLVQMESDLHRSWLDVTGQPHVDCPKCKYALKLPTNVLPDTSLKCSNCFEVCYVSPSTTGGNPDYLNLKATNPETMDASNTIDISTSHSAPTSGQLKLSDAMSTINQATSEFSKAPTVNPKVDDLSAHKAIFEPKSDKEDESEIVNSFANNV